LFFFRRLMASLSGGYHAAATTPGAPSGVSCGDVAAFGGASGMNVTPPQSRSPTRGIRGYDNTTADAGTGAGVRGVSPAMGLLKYGLPPARSAGGAYSGTTTPRPGIYSGRTTPRQGSTTPTSTRETANPLLAAIRREVEACETRLSARVLRVEKLGETLREQAHSRFEEKLGELTSAQPIFDRKLAEMSGSLKALTEELQAQVRRINQTDSRLFDAQRRMEDGWRKRTTELEQQMETLSGGGRVGNSANEESHKRHADKARLLQNHLGNHADTLGAMSQLHDEHSDRLEAIESQLQNKNAALKMATSVEEPSALWRCEHEASQATRDAERLAMELRRTQTLSEEHAVRLNSLGTRLQVQEERFQGRMEDQDEKFKRFVASVDGFGLQRKQAALITNADSQEAHAVFRTETVQKLEDLSRHAAQHDEAIMRFEELHCIIDASSNDHNLLSGPQSMIAPSKEYMSSLRPGEELGPVDRQIAALNAKLEMHSNSGIDGGQAQLPPLDLSMAYAAPPNLGVVVGDGAQFAALGAHLGATSSSTGILAEESANAPTLDGMIAALDAEIAVLQNGCEKSEQSRQFSDAGPTMPYLAALQPDDHMTERGVTFIEDFTVASKS